MTKAEWAGAEFDGATLRLWIDGDMSERRVSRDPEQVLQAMLADRNATGVAILRSGWPDASLKAVPSRVMLDAADGMLPALTQKQPTDLMRYQPGRIRGYLAKSPEFDGVICLVGNSTVWAHISAAEVVSFRSFLTAELLGVIGSFDGLSVNSDLDTAAFTDAVNHAISRPSAIAADLAGLRAELALGQMDSNAAASRFAGLLIGIELAAAKPYWLGQDIFVIGNGVWAEHYMTALASQGLTARQEDGVAMAKAGLADACRALQSSDEH